MEKKKRKLSFKKIVLLIAIAVFLSLNGKTLAKYVIEEFHSYYLNSQHFYFTSDRLKKTPATYLVNNWSGAGAFDISFNLSGMKNSLVYSDYDIPYTVTATCPTGVTCVPDKPTGTVRKAATDHSDTVTVRVTPSTAYGEGKTLHVVISASSTAPYIETISANFDYVVGKAGITYEIEDEANRAYMMFKITNAINYCTVIEAFDRYRVDDTIESSIYRQLSPTDRAKCVGEPVTLTFNPNVIVLDTTSNVISGMTVGNTTIGGVDYVSSLAFNIEPLSTVAIKFYKTNTSNNYTYNVNSNTTCIVTVS